MEASPSDLSVSSIVLQSPERFFDRRLSVRVHIAGNKKVQLSALRLQAVPRSADLPSLYQWKKNPSRRVWFSTVRVSTVPSASRSSGILCTAEGWDSSVEFWNLKIRCFCPRSRIIITESFYFLCDLDWMIIVHLDHMIRNIEDSTGTASHQNGGNTSSFIQISSTLQEGCDWFLFPADHLLHELIPKHEVGSRGVLVN